MARTRRTSTESSAGELARIRAEIAKALTGPKVVRLIAARRAAAKAQAAAATAQDALKAVLDQPGHGADAAPLRRAGERASAAKAEAVVRRERVAEAIAAATPAVHAALRHPTDSLAALIMHRLAELEAAMDPLLEVRAALVREGIVLPPILAAVPGMQERLRAMRVSAGDRHRAGVAFPTICERGVSGS